MLHHHVPSLTTELCNENLHHDQQVRSSQVFKEFVESTVRGVMNLENNRRCDLSSSLAVFCRVDVAICQPTPGGPFHYYVNELERSLSVGLFRRVCPANTLSMVNNTVRCIPAFISHSRASAIRRD